ncbi:uncharacterized protein LOC110023148 [Phalaenopsis equestris]|uniref:uncharacterized protein LOC110023148 n=1 Tax=Phalaenopsis equestris TaxID=78828 RepID=UPI0009E52324|nr:uncharacterized protein LOC110023148 [Phalaenopsis equestris]XP_020578075.1 uncharacterized protein LOC110023148 [Phalaenopsis equestris]
MEALSFRRGSPISPPSNPSTEAGYDSAEKEANKKKTKPARSRRIGEERNNGAPPRWQRKGKGAVMLEGYFEVTEGGQKRSEGGEEMVGRTKSLTDDDLEELRGCLDLGFGFVYEEIPELCNTLPALELCYSMSQKFLDEQQQKHSSGVAGEVGAPSTPVANWKISSPGDHPDDVKARLKYWAQAVACTVRLCN